MYFFRYPSEQPGDEEDDENSGSAHARIDAMETLDSKAPMPRVRPPNRAKVCTYIVEYFVLREVVNPTSNENLPPHPTRLTHSTCFEERLSVPFQNNIFSTFFRCNFDYFVANILRFGGGGERSRHFRSTIVKMNEKKERPLRR